MSALAPSSATVEAGPSGRWTDRGLRFLEIALAIMGFGGAIGLLGGAIAVEGPMQDVPFGSPILAGVALGLVNGVLPTAVVIGEVRHAPWARPGHLVVGLALMGWIVVQVGFIGLVSWMQPALFAYGAAIAVLGWLHWRRTGGSA